ncbi:MAG TPA: YsnF/AvaK domain-containing protein [Beijerinckiaceae bacterium]|jgi:stress response protein YsnF
MTASDRPVVDRPGESLLAEERLVEGVTLGEERLSIPLVEETLRVNKLVETSRVRVRTVTDTVEEIARASLESQNVEVERVPVGREVTTAPEVRTEGDVTIIPILEEVLVVEKRLVLKEELHLRRRVTTETFEEPVTLRRQRAEVERIDEDG